MRIAPDLHIVGSGDAGLNLSGALDANCYLVDTGNGLWLFDVGFDGCDRILENIEADGLDPSDIVRIFLTHHHADHAGATADFAERLPDCKIGAAAESAAGIRAGDETVNGLAWARDVGYYPASFSLRPSRVDMELRSGMQFTRGRWRVRTIATPGHCAGHFSFLVQRPGASVLIGGDQVFCDGRILLQNLPDVDIRQCAASMERLLALEFETLLPGHGRFSLERGKRHLEAAHAVFSGIGVPPNLV